MHPPKKPIPREDPDVSDDAVLIGKLMAEVMAVKEDVADVKKDVADLKKDVHGREGGRRVLKGIAWALGFLIPVVLGVLGWFVSTTVSTSHAAVSLERTVEADRIAQTKLDTDVRTLQTNVQTLTVEVRRDEQVEVERFEAIRDSLDRLERRRR